MSGADGSSTDERTDGVLARALRDAGDTMAFEALVKRYERPLYSFIVRQVGSRRDAQDLYQQTLLRILDRIETCTNPDAFKPWCFGIASNLCRNYFRAKRTEAVGEVPDVPSPKPDPEQTATSMQTAQRIARAVGDLNPAQREVFVLHHYHQLSYDDIATAIGTPLGTVKSRMNSALTHLRSLLVSLGEGVS